MSHSPDPTVNPDPHPARNAEPVEAMVVDSEDQELVTSFREQILALGAAWIFIGVLALVLMAYIFFTSNRSELPSTLYIASVIGNALLWIIVGSLTCLRFMWAIYVGRVLSVLSALCMLLTLNVIGLVLICIVIYQAYRVIGFASEMEARGIPLGGS
jgi:hypothetical protein